MIGIALTFVILILAGLAPGQTQAPAWCVPLFVSSCGSEICGFVEKQSSNSNGHYVPGSNRLQWHAESVTRVQRVYASIDKYPYIRE